MSGSLQAHMEKRRSKFWVSRLCSLECPIKFANQLEAERSKAQLLPNVQQELLLALHSSLSSDVFVFRGSSLTPPPPSKFLSPNNFAESLISQKQAQMTPFWLHLFKVLIIGTDCTALHLQPPLLGVAPS